MANTTAVCNSFKRELFTATHAFDTTVPAHTLNSVDTFKGALYVTTAALGGTTAAYSTTGEVGNSGEYAAGGKAFTNATAVTNNAATTYWTPSASLSWTGVTFTTDTVLMYNSSQSNKGVAVFNFGTQSPTAATFTLSMPTNNETTGLLRLS